METKEKKEKEPVATVMGYRIVGDKGGEKLRLTVEGETIVVWSQVFDEELPEGWVVLDEALEAAHKSVGEVAEEKAAAKAQAEADAIELDDLRKFKADAVAKADADAKAAAKK